LTTEACLAAIADAGLTRDDIDGLSTYPGGDAVTSTGFGGPGAAHMQDALRLNLNWIDSGGEGAAQLGAIVTAAFAVASGAARHVLVYRTVTESTVQGAGGRRLLNDTQEARASGWLQWLQPFGAVSAANWLALVAQRHFHEFGTTREQLGQIALTCRANAVLNERAVYRDPLSMEDYLSARMISSPLCLYDCDVPVDGSTAFVVSHVDHAADAPWVPVHINAVGTAQRGRPSWDQYADMTSMFAQGAAEHLWSRTDLKPSDVDQVQLYDGFSIITLVWLEALGFCGRGEGGAFIEGGSRIARTGELPLNTHGGQLSEGRLHGFGHVWEACVQLRGIGEHRQVGSPEVVAVANGGGPIAGAMLLTRGIGD
ncbi:thiolase family protein, partial [Nocardioides sp.]|uniref:thiolase family protein n=1 Tax=Nocardioides sp. TaxID=35761 RepID=UPI0027374B3F